MIEFDTFRTGFNMRQCERSKLNDPSGPNLSRQEVMIRNSQGTYGRQNCKLNMRRYQYYRRKSMGPFCDCVCDVDDAGGGGAKSEKAPLLLLVAELAALGVAVSEKEL